MAALPRPLSADEYETQGGKSYGYKMFIVESTPVWTPVTEPMVMSVEPKFDGPKTRRGTDADGRGYRNKLAKRRKKKKKS